VANDVQKAQLLAWLKPIVAGWMGIWTTYTPAWTAVTTNPAIGNGTLTGKYIIRPGGTCILRIYLVAGGTTMFGSGAWSFGMPAGIVAANDVVQGLGLAIIKDFSTGALYPRLVQVVPGASTLTYLTQFNDANTAAQQFTSAIPFTWATQDYMHLQVEFAVGSGSW
jgi:hypothetical protein